MARYSDLKKIAGRKNYYRNPISGKIHYKEGQQKFSTHTDKIGEAVRYVQERLFKTLAPGARGQAMRKKAGIHNPLVFDIWKELLDSRAPDISHSTMLTWKKNWAHGMAGFWSDMHAADMTDANIIKFKLWYMENNSTRHAKKTVIHFRALIKFMVKQRVLVVAPDLSPLATLHENIEKVAKRVPAGRVYSQTEVRAMIAACDKIDSDRLAARARLGILLGACGGLRKNEALRLKWENVDFGRKILRVWSQKNHKWRDVPAVDELLAQLRNAKREAGAGEGFIFPMPSDHARPISSQIFDKVWIRAKELAEITGRARFHDLRHTFATWTAEAGWPPVVACEVLDQSLITYQSIYCRASADSKAEWMAKTFGVRDGGAKNSSTKVQPKQLSAKRSR